MIGNNSITRSLIISNQSDPKHAYEVLVQANKHYGICDIILPNLPVALAKPVEASQIEAYFESKRAYDIELANYKKTRSHLLNYVQGNQIDNEEVMAFLANMLYLELNNI